MLVNFGPCIFIVAALAINRQIQRATINSGESCHSCCAFYAQPFCHWIIGGSSSLFYCCYCSSVTQLAAIIQHKHKHADKCIYAYTHRYSHVSRNADNNAALPASDCRFCCDLQSPIPNLQYAISSPQTSWLVCPMHSCSDLHAASCPSRPLPVRVPLCVCRCILTPAPRFNWTVTVHPFGVNHKGCEGQTHSLIASTWNNVISFCAAVGNMGSGVDWGTSVRLPHLPNWIELLVGCFGLVNSL